MNKIVRFVSLGIAATMLLPALAEAKDYQVRMLNNGDGVTFLAVNAGHNVESLDGMIPAGATPFKGGFNQPVTVKLTKPGLYGYKCLPHGAMGMVGPHPGRCPGQQGAIGRRRDEPARAGQEEDGRSPRPGALAEECGRRSNVRPDLPMRGLSLFRSGGTAPARG
jgi:hypothetical protein